MKRLSSVFGCCLWARAARIQIAHMAPYADYVIGARDEALKLLADAIAAGNPATKNMYFDRAGNVVEVHSPAALGTLAKRLRTIGLHRVLFGSELPFGPGYRLFSTYR